MNLHLPDLPGAVCASIGPSDALWFPEKGKASHESRQAKDLCGTCPARTACLEWAMENHEEGVWGGTTAKEREVLRRNIKKERPQPSPAAINRRAKWGTAECGSVAGYHKHTRERTAICPPCREARRVEAADARASKKAS